MIYAELSVSLMPWELRQSEVLMFMIWRVLWTNYENEVVIKYREYGSLWAG